MNERGTTGRTGLKVFAAGCSLLLLSGIVACRDAASPDGTPASATGTAEPSAGTAAAVPAVSPTPLPSWVADVERMALRIEDVAAGSEVVGVTPLTVDDLMTFYPGFATLRDSLTDAGYVGGYFISFAGGGSRITSFITLFETEEGAAAAFTALTAAGDGPQQTSESADITRQVTAPYDVAIGSEATGVYTEIDVKSTTGSDVQTTFKSRTINFRTGPVVAMLSSIPALDEDGQLSLANAQLRRIEEALAAASN